MPVSPEIRAQVSAQLLDSVAVGLTSRMKICATLTCAGKPSYSLSRLARRLQDHKWKWHEIVKLNHSGIISIELPENC